MTMTSTPVPGVAFPAYGTQEMRRVQAHRQDGQVSEQPEWHGEPDDYAGEPDEYTAEPGSEAMPSGTAPCSPNDSHAKPNAKRC